MPNKPYAITKDGEVDIAAVARQLQENGEELQRLGHQLKIKFKVLAAQADALNNVVTGDFKKDD